MYLSPHMPSHLELSKIVTHPGSAHKDELLACALLIATNEVPIERRDPKTADLEDPSVAVIDVGDRHSPEKNNYDHHQFPREHTPTCSLSLVLQALNRYEAAKQFCAWLEPAEWFDCRGPKDTAEFLGVPREAINQLNSPIDVTLLRRFASRETIQPGEPIHEILKLVGQDLIGYIDGLLEKVAYIEKHSALWTLHTKAGERSILFLPRLDPLPPEPSAGLGIYVEQAGLANQVVGLVYPDRRGDGYGLSRYNDSMELDFNRVRKEPDIQFAHARGFVAKTTATDPARLQALIKRAANNGI